MNRAISYNLDKLGFKKYTRDQNGFGGRYIRFGELNIQVDRFANVCLYLKCSEIERFKLTPRNAKNILIKAKQITSKILISLAVRTEEILSINRELIKQIK